jgi:hypothetical protein
MSLVNNCGGLHIRTAITDPSLVPNTITQLIVANGLRIGIIPQSTRTSNYYIVNIKNSSDELILQSDQIPYIGTNNYIYVPIPFKSIPQINETVKIQIVSDNSCTASINYIIQSYILPNVDENSTTILVNNVLEKYIKIKPTITSGGFKSGETYYYKYDTTNDTDSECFLKFKNNKDLSKILDNLPTNYNTQICPPTLEWNFSDIICITPVTTTTVLTCKLFCTIFKKLSGSIYQASYTHENVTTFTWTVYNSTQTPVLSGTINTNIGSSFNVDLEMLGSGTYKFVIAPTNCTISTPTGDKTFTYVSTITTTVQTITNIVPDLEITDETYWNYFNPDKIPDIIIPNRLDSITNKYIPNKWLFFHSYQGLSIFGSTATTKLQKLFKKGFTHISSESLPTYETNLENIVTGDKIIGDIETIVNDDSLENFKQFVSNSFSFADTYKITKTDNKFNLFANFIDYNGRLAYTQSQEAVNYLVTGLYSGLEHTNGRFGYTKLSYDATLGYIISDSYTRGNLTNFIGYSNNTVENNYKNKSLKDSNRLLVGSEQTYYYETILPQNYQVKDQTDTNWFTINHFGGEATNTVGVGLTPNCEHWASQIAGNTQNLYNRAKEFGQDLIMTLKPTCDRGETYLHSKSKSIYYNGKYIKEYGRYENTLYDIGAGQEYLSNFETESLPNFVAEGQIILAYFSGARGVNFSSKYFTKELTPRLKTTFLKRGTRYDDITIGNQDYENYNHTMKAMWRLSQKVAILPNISYSFFDICDGNETYLNIDTEVSYDGGTNFLKQRALDWQINQKSPVMTVVNLQKNSIAICALQAYGVEQNSAIVRYKLNGRNFEKTILIPSDKISLYIFDLGATS